MAICFLAGCQAGWSRRDFGHGGLVALTSILIGFVVALLGNVSTVLAIALFRPIDLSQRLHAAMDVPLPVMLLIGGLIGAVGAAVGAGSSRLARRHSPRD